MTIPPARRALVISATFAFALGAKHRALAPAEWYETLAGYVGTQTIPDSYGYLPGAEFVVLGRVRAPERIGHALRAQIVAGNIDVEFDLFAERDGVGALTPDATQALYDERDNPLGRRRDADAPPLIVDARDRDAPLWLGQTPFDHPLRVRSGGASWEGVLPGQWPESANAWVLADAHPRFHCERLDPGARVALRSLLHESAPEEFTLPRYRVEVTFARDDLVFRNVPARVHTVAVVPSAQVGAMSWRAAIDLPESDALGQRVILLLGALRDADEPLRDAEEWGRIAVERLTNPSKMADERPILPRELAAAVVLPSAAPPADDPVLKRYEAAREWAQGELAGPALEAAPHAEPSADQFLGDATDALGDEESPLDPPALDKVADSALALARKRHADAGFDPESREPHPKERGRGESALLAEIRSRLSGPYRSEHERALARAHGAGRAEDSQQLAKELDDALARLADARAMSPTALPAYDLLPEEEALRFGEAFVAHLDERELERHLDVAGMHVVAPGERDAPGAEREALVLEGHSFAGLFCEHSRFAHVRFVDCVFDGATFAESQFEHCVFERCSFIATNLSSAQIAVCRFVECTWERMRFANATWFDARFAHCTWDDVAITDLAMRDLRFHGGSWSRVALIDGLWIGCVMRSMRWHDVTIASVHAPQCTLAALFLEKVWVTGNGFCESEWEEVEARTCGFLSTARLDRNRFSRCRFYETGFSSAVFASVTIDGGCRFHRCDFSSAFFVDAKIPGVRFVQCSFVGSQWGEVDAREAWFHGCLMRAVDLRSVRCAKAVFVDADLEHTRFDFERTIGTDFRGTVREGA